MEQPISRSEKKRRAKALETLAVELIALPKRTIGQLPCESFLKDEILRAASLKGGARKRQLKYISKNLRQMECEPILDFLAAERGSRLKEKRLFHELESLRDKIVADAFEARRRAQEEDLPFAGRDWPSGAVDTACKIYPAAQELLLKEAAAGFVVTNKPTYKRELFRLLKTAEEESRQKN